MTLIGVAKSDMMGYKALESPKHTYITRVLNVLGEADKYPAVYDNSYCSYQRSNKVNDSLARVQTVEIKDSVREM